MSRKRLDELGGRNGQKKFYMVKRVGDIGIYIYQVVHIVLPICLVEKKINSSCKNFS